MNLDKITNSFLNKIEDNSLRELLVYLLNKQEEQTQLIRSQAETVQRLKDEINRLKGEQGKPKFAKTSNPNRTNYSSEQERKVSKKWSKKEKKSTLPIDKEVKCALTSLEKEQLPSDLTFLRYETVVQQDLKLVRTNTSYKIAIYYSAKQAKTYRAKLPKGYTGYFGNNLKCLIHILTYQCDVTRSKLLVLLASSGIEISTGSLNNILQDQSCMYEKEYNQILRAGLSVGYCGMDSTGSKQKGVRQYTQILTNHLFTAFSSRNSKSRQSLLSTLQAVKMSDLKMRYNAHAKKKIDDFEISERDKSSIEQLLEVEKVYTRQQLDQLFTKKLPKFRAKKTMYRRFEESVAIAYYQSQQDCPVVSNLVTDDAKEYQSIASTHQLCWVHDVRYYKKLTPTIAFQKELLDGFLGQYWEYYRKLLDYKQNPTKNLAQQLDKEFEGLFNRETDYLTLNKQIARTYNNKKKLLAVLQYPQLPIHNNAAELGARKVVSKRNVSLHTINDTGTMVRDAALTIIETAKKHKVNIVDYLMDRISGNYNMVNLNTLIYKAC